ncbi:MAG: glycine cleavage system protein GcvH [Planctomycetota bacterium]
MKPEDLLFAKTHEWAHVAEQDGDKIATVGISAFAVEALTDLVFMELPSVGLQVEPEQAFCEVESVKAVSDVYAPVAGELVAVNAQLPDALEKLSEDPYGFGWIARIKMSGDADSAHLMDFPAYQKQCEEEA